MNRVHTCPAFPSVRRLLRALAAGAAAFLVALTVVFFAQYLWACYSEPRVFARIRTGMERAEVDGILNGWEGGKVPRTDDSPERVTVRYDGMVFESFVTYDHGRVVRMYGYLD